MDKYMDKYGKDKKEKEDKKNVISEADTQAILVEPILCFAGFDVGNVFEVKRSKSRKSDFDLKVYKDGRFVIGIEVKSIGSTEFNIKGVCKKIDGRIRVGKKVGKLEDLENGNNKYKNRSKDGVGQLRLYVFESNPKPAVAILTNGVKWGVFKDVNAFAENPKEPLSSNFFQDPSKFECFNIDDIGNFERLIRFLKNKAY